jgi:S1/P1 Nuclease
MRRALFAFTLAATILSSTSAFAWGDAGHRITGYIANTALTDKTRTKLRALLGSDDLSTVATWMDHERDQLAKQMPSSSRWHYENRAVCSSNPAQGICPHGQCITHQIDRLRIQLTDAHSTNEQRAIAIRMLVHLIGDLHQPLHLSDNDDRGGNDVYVYVGSDREPRNLHEVWDTHLLHMNLHRTGEQRYSMQLLSRYSSRLASWQQGDISTWATETYVIGKESAYLPLPNFACGTHSSHAIRLPDEYVNQARQTVNEQLVKAGLRIAMVLNEAL